MSNPCETVNQCIDAVDVLDDEIKRATRQRRDVVEQLTSLVVEDCQRGRLPWQVLKVDIGLIKRITRQRQGH